MGLIAEFVIASEDFALDDALSSASEMLVEIEEVVATGENRLMPYFWVSGGDRETFERALADDPSVENTVHVDEVDGATLYRADWTENIETVIYAYTEIGATILQASGQDRYWELEMRFDDEEKLADFQQFCRENEIDVELRRLSEQNQPMASTQYGLTEKQRDALVAARDAGYFEVPQQTTLEALAEELGVSSQALSKRLHHGHHNLITNTLVVGREET